ncbi:unnamed protein product [Lymnaea stagnalis]|uniref:PARP12-like CCCH zinc finger tandem domain-containing protein n=1 Tax=Lymnaea stagnalis TaxID=6523 RepID=A0AAV2H1M1_LYMST
MENKKYYYGSYDSHRRLESRPIANNLVQIINNTNRGYLDLQAIMDTLRVSDREYLWKVLNDHKDNFRIDERNKRASQLNGTELVNVFTKLTLCETHCRQAADGRNRNCNGRCEALHLCRTFLLCSEDACTFHKSRNCMFGHDFDTPHNAPLLREHNLDRLDDNELRRLFRRPSSRSKTTMPQVCIYYNDIKGKRCANEKCKSLHLCSDYIEDHCFYDCPRNHNLSDKQVKKILDLFGIDSSWREPLLLEHLMRFNNSRRQAGKSDDDISSYKGSEYNTSYIRGATSVSNYTHLKRKRKSSSGEEEDNRMSSSSACPGCTMLQKEVEELKKEVFSLRTDVLELKQKDKKTHSANDSGNSSSERTLSGNPLCMPASSINFIESHEEVGSSQVKRTREDDEFDID